MLGVILFWLAATAYVIACNVVAWLLHWRVRRWLAARWPDASGEGSGV